MNWLIALRSIVSEQNAKFARIIAKGRLTSPVHKYEETEGQYTVSFNKTTLQIKIVSATDFRVAVLILQQRLLHNFARKFKCCSKLSR